VNMRHMANGLLSVTDYQRLISFMNKPGLNRKTPDVSASAALSVK